MKYLAIISLFIFYFTSTCSSQDLHFSAWEEMPHLVNPAYTGMIKGNYTNRLLTGHRRQWNAALGRADYETYYGSYDHRLSFCKNSIAGVYIGLGLDVYHDQVGTIIGEESQFYSNNKVNGNFAFGFVASKSFSIVVGANLGWMNYRLDDSQLTYDNQFGQFDYDPSLPTGENFAYENLNYLDTGAGLLLRGELNKLVRLEGGIAFLHLTGANKKFLENSNTRELKREYRTHLTVNFDKGGKTAMNVYLAHYKYGGLVSGNGKQWQANMRVEAIRRPNRNNDIHLGVGARISNVDGKGINPDALIIVAKWKPYMGTGQGYNSTKNVTLGISYDLNISPYLAKATSGRGSIEFFMSYAFGKDDKVCCKPW